MIKCKIDQEKAFIYVKAKGTGETINTELLALIQQLYLDIKRQSEQAAEIFRITTIGALLDPESPVWKGDVTRE